MVQPTQSNRLYHLFLIAVLIVSCYSNTFHVPWILDDKPNILDNPPIHLSSFTFSSLTDSFYAYPNNQGKLYRPVACVSFALNWLVSGDKVAAYHLVNITIHICTALFLYLTTNLLLRLVLSRDRYQKTGALIALVSTLLWAVNPVQTQAITYIVQRMASLAGMFYIISIYCYLIFRTATSSRSKKYFSLIICAFSFLFAYMSKQNAILLPLSLLVIEIIFFQSPLKYLQSRRQRTIFLSLLLFFFLAALLLVLFKVFPTTDYSHRTFTLSQRLLTEQRVILFYLSLLFFPVSSRLSLEHDFMLSSTLFFPISTFFSFLVVLSAVIFCLKYYKRYPLPCFSISFFLVNHIVESTIIPLELVFEHRNYIPSFFLFLPLSSFLVSLYQKTRSTNVSVSFTLALIISSIIYLFSFNTYQRNKVWSSELTILEDAIQKAPNSSRVVTNLAKLYMESGDLRGARELAERSFDLQHPSKNYAKAISLHAQAVIAHFEQDDRSAAELLQKSLTYIPDYNEANKNLIIILCNQHKYEEAYRRFDSVSSKSNYSNQHLETVILLRLFRPQQALSLLRKTRPTEILEVNLMTGIGSAMIMLNNFEQADFFLRKASLFSVTAALKNIENLLYMKKNGQATEEWNSMLERFSAAAVFDLLTTDNPIDYPIDRKLILDFVRTQLYLF